MRLIGFNLTKMIAERFSNINGDLKIETAINLESIEENTKIPNKQENFFLDVSFKYSIDYSVKIAKIELEGKILLSVDQKLGKEIIKTWKKKKLDEKTKMAIFNGILMKSNIKAIQLEDELGLPTHFKLPSLKISPEKSE